MRTTRLNRLFNPKTRCCFDVALDQGFFDGVGFHAGIEGLPKAIKILVEAAPDAIQLAVGQAGRLQALAAKPKPALRVAALEGMGTRSVVSV